MDLFSLLWPNALYLDCSAAVVNKLFCATTFYLSRWNTYPDTYFTAARTVALHQKFLIRP